MTRLRAEPTPSAASVSFPRLELFILFVGSRLMLYVIAGLSLLGIGKSPDFLPPRTIADWFLRWDALWYFDVAEHGYHYGPGDPTNVGYFPLYPWLVRLVSLGGRIDYRYAGYAVSLTGLWLACVLLWKLVVREYRDARLATLAVTFLLFSPVSFFFSTMYSESWFIPLTIGSLLAARLDRWWLAGLLGALAALTRLVGIALIVPLAWECLLSMRSKDNGFRFSWARLVPCALPAAGYAAYALVMWSKFGNPLMYSQAQLESGRHFTWFWGLFARDSFHGLPAFYRVWFAGTVLLAFGLLLAGALVRIRTTYTVYVLTFAGIYISARFADSLPRYFGGLFPLYIIVALIAHRWPKSSTLLIAASTALQTLSVILFVNGYWFT